MKFSLKIWFDFYVLMIVMVSVFSCQKKIEFKQGYNDIQIDSVSLLLNEIISKPIQEQEKRNLLQKVFYLNNKNKGDSIKLDNFLKMCLLSNEPKDSVFFNMVFRESLALSMKLSDTLNIAKNYWIRASFHAKQEQFDSSFYYYNKAYKLYGKKNESLLEAKMLYNIALIQSRFKDYTSSELSLFRGLKLLKNNEDNFTEYKCYSLLGSTYKNMGDYKLSLEFHNKALNSIGKIEKEKSLLLLRGTFNNIGLVYQEMGDYPNALTYFNRASDVVDEGLISQESRARLEDNFAYTRLLNKDTLGVHDDLMQSLKIREHTNNLSGIVINKLHLAEYFQSKGDFSRAFQYANEAYETASEVKNNRDILASLKILSELNPNNSQVYLSKYVAITEELNNQERHLRNKLGRIQFETDEYIAEANTLSSQRTFIIVGSTLLLLLLSALYYILLQDSKYKNLKLKSKNQEAEEEIYKLMLDQHTKMEEGRLNERERISRELHDGILGKLYGARLSLGFLDLEGQKDTLKKYDHLIGELHQIEKEIRIVSHELKNDLFSSENNFRALMESLIEKQSAIGKYSYELQYGQNINLDELSYATKFNCYRILQEVLLNINKHANANHVNIMFNLLNVSGLSVVVEDNGVGFEVGMNPKGIGLQNISQRVSQQGGELMIESKVNQGTRIEIHLPR